MNARSAPLLKPLIGQFRPDTALPSVPDIDYCPFPATIDCPADYRSKRSIDGSCNNLIRSIIGRSMTPFRRLVPAKYHDGLTSFVIPAWLYLFGYSCLVMPLLCLFSYKSLVIPFFIHSSLVM